MPDQAITIPGYTALSQFEKQGGMGTIYLGKQEATHREVIVKLMNSSADPDQRVRFAREVLIARILERSIPNEHVLASIDHGELATSGSSETTPYLVYPYIKYGSLSSQLSEKPWETWSLLTIADIVMQAAEGLFHLHKNGFAHQDVKPSNFLWTPVRVAEQPDRRKHIWLIDFGATQLEDKPGVQTNSPIGTPGYLAPEQLARQVRCSADQYALAVMARLLLTGDFPLAKHGSPITTPLTRLNPQRLHEREIDRVMLRAMALRPDSRFETIIQFAQSLQNAIRKQEQPAFYNSPTESVAPPPNHQTSHPPYPPFPPPPVQKAPERLIIPPIPHSEPYKSVNELPSTPQPSHTPVAFNQHSLPIFRLQNPISEELPERPNLLTWSPDGSALLCTFPDEAPLLFTENPTEIPASFATAHCACWSPDSRFLAFSMKNDRQPPEIQFWSPDAPKKIYPQFPFRRGTAIYGIDWSHSSGLALWLENELLNSDLSALPTPHPRLPFPRPILSLGDMQCSRYTVLRWSPDGEWLAAGASNGKLICWHAGSPLYKQQPLIESVSSLCWSPDSTILLIAFSNSKKIMFWNLRTGAIAWENVPDRPRTVSISPQNAQFVVATDSALFFGNIDHAALTASGQGQRHVAWSRTNRLATLDPRDETRLVIYQTP